MIDLFLGIGIRRAHGNMGALNSMIDLTKVYEITPQWLAGFFDGEGLVGIYKDNNRPNSYNLEVKIAQKDITVLVLIASKFKNGHWKKSQQCNEFVFHGKYAKEFLEFILPYAIVKKTQIELALQYLNGKIKGEVVELLKKEKQCIGF